MRVSTILALTFSALVAAQTEEPPSCASLCLFQTKPEDLGGCDMDDANCLCTNKKVSERVNFCADSECSKDDAELVKTAWKASCEILGSASALPTDLSQLSTLLPSGVSIPTALPTTLPSGIVTRSSTTGGSLTTPAPSSGSPTPSSQEEGAQSSGTTGTAGARETGAASNVVLGKGGMMVAAAGAVLGLAL